MPDVTITPIAVDTVGDGSGSSSGDLFAGNNTTLPEFWQVGGNLYGILQHSINEGAGSAIDVYQFNLDGTNPVRLDAAHSPQVQGFGLCFAQLIGNVIWFAYGGTTFSSTILSFGKFDIGTGLFSLGVLPDIGPTPGPARLPNAQFCIFTGGTTAIATYSASSGQIGYRYFSGGTWGAFQSIANAGGHTYLSDDLIYDSSGNNAYLVFQDQTALGVFTWQIVQITNAGIAGAITQITGNTKNDVMSHGLISGGNIYIPIARGGPGSSKASIFSAALPGAGVWAITDLQSDTNQNTILSVYTSVDGAGLITAFWNFQDLSGLPDVVNRSQLVAGVWSAPTLYYDLAALPPAWKASVYDAPNNSVTQIMTVSITNGNLAAITTIGGNLPFNTFIMVGGTASPAPGMKSSIITATIFPFPMGVNCCCPEDVACLHPSADGEYYISSKGVQSK